MGIAVRAGASREPLSRRVRLIVLAAVIATHAGGGWALTQAAPAKLVVGEAAPMEVRMVAAEQAAAAPAEPPQPEPPQPEVPLAEPPPPPEVPVTDLASVVDPPPPDLPPPAFPVAAKPPPPPPPPPKPPAPKPPAEKPRPVQAPATPAAPAEATAPAATAAPAAPKTVAASQVSYLVPPNPVYPPRSRRAGEQGTTTVRVLVDIAGRPTQISLQGSSGHAALDESALAAVRAARFRPYVEAGQPQAVWVAISIRFVLQ